MKITDEKIEQILAPHYSEDELPVYYCHGNMQPTFKDSLLLGVFSSFKTKFFILGFTSQSLVMVKLDLMSNPKETTVIPYREFRDVQISNLFLGLGKKLHIYLYDGKVIKLNLSKRAGGIKKQQENIENICTMFENKWGK
ncbi:PH domain-containing protein [Anaeromicrobium sediminis]|uniref:Uncharacterized protein n=1 Tax=Anaeromicrobium sediminis TaxID=1478221 RepID=A0A267MR06_9FIRM|nr:PH domain-containing protein [Anaeromicrobium sediminis]PAB61160.1 hypothetical protein CCE28_01675 [Anaeromicrobium sediminis]